MEKTYNEVIGLSNTLGGMSRDKHPFSITLGKNIKVIDKVVADYNELRMAIIDKYVKRDEKGDALGVMKAVDVAEGEEPRMERVKNPQRIDETEWSDRDAFEKELGELNMQKISFELTPVDASTVYLNLQVNKELTIRQYLDSNMEPGLLLYLNEYGFWSNLGI